MTFPFAEPLTPIAPGPRVVPEPRRRGEPGGEECGVCGREDHIWRDDTWAVYNPVGGSIPGTVWLASRVHVDSFMDLPPEALNDLGRVVALIERAVLSLGGFARVHLYRWGDGGAHFHVWFLPRPLGMLEATKQYLPLWEEQLPTAAPEDVEAAGKLIGDFLTAHSG
jgi:diadenosine tetraphosphate (Ap4A) HIT family hydrolase